MKCLEITRIFDFVLMFLLEFVTFLNMLIALGHGFSISEAFFVLKLKTNFKFSNYVLCNIT